MFTPSFENEGSHSPDQLIAGDHPIRTRGLTLAADQELTRGTVVVKVGTDTEYTAYAGTEPAAGSLIGILITDVDTTGAASTEPAYIAGDFNTNELTVASGDVNDLRDPMVKQSMYLHDAVPA